MDTVSTADLVHAAERLLDRPLRLVRALTGGQHARTVLVSDGDRQLVLRRFPPGDDAVSRELAVLPRLDPLGPIAPRLVAHGETPAGPLIVTTALPGGPPAPELDPIVLAEQMGPALAEIHRLDPSGLPDEDRAPTSDAGELAAAAQSAWQGADMTRVLTHGDFWSGNTVWQGDRLAGIVDWSGAMSAPRGVDVAWCRQDLVLLGSVAAAERFTSVYEEAAGLRLPDVRAWDLVAAARADPYVETWAPNYEGIGRPDVTSVVIRQRFDAWVRRLLG